MPDLRSRLVDWSGSVAEDRCVNVWIAGGGAFVEGVRNWQTLHGLEEHVAHRVSIGLMSQTAELFQSMFLDWPLLVDVQQLDAVDPITTPNIVFDCRQWALNNMSLERSWETTSDTISLQLAIATRSSHLFLLKSKLPQSGSVSEAMKDGLIDQNFNTGRLKGSQLKVSITNLRESNALVELTW